MGLTPMNTWAAAACPERRIDDPTRPAAQHGKLALNPQTLADPGDRASRKKMPNDRRIARGNERG